MIKQQRCLLCGQEYPAGLHVMGCLICFPCEKRLLSCAETELPPRTARLKLVKLYGGVSHCAKNTCTH